MAETRRDKLLKRLRDYGQSVPEWGLPEEKLALLVENARQSALNRRWGLRVFEVARMLTPRPMSWAKFHEREDALGHAARQEWEREPRPLDLIALDVIRAHDAWFAKNCLAGDFESRLAAARSAPDHSERQRDLLQALQIDPDSPTASIDDEFLRRGWTDIDNAYDQFFANYRESRLDAQGRVWIMARAESLMRGDDTLTETNAVRLAHEELRKSGAISRIEEEAPGDGGSAMTKKASSRLWILMACLAAFAAGLWWLVRR